MGFYNEWKECQNTEHEKYYINSFLNKTPESLETLLYGSKEELLFLYQFLREIPINKFVESIDTDTLFSAEDIVQFSNLNHAINNVCICCATSENALTFNELGKMIMHSKLDGACKKYGENHSKTAADLSLVTLVKSRAYVVSNTSLGKFLISIDDDKNDFIKILAIRNRFIKSIIYNAKHGIVIYGDLAIRVLSKSTSNRRKSNVKKIVNLILDKNELLNNIIW